MTVGAAPIEARLKPVDTVLNAFTFAEFHVGRDAPESGDHRRQRGLGKENAAGYMPLPQTNELLRITRRATKDKAVSRPRLRQFEIAIDRARAGDGGAARGTAFATADEAQPVERIGLQGERLGAPQCLIASGASDHEDASFRIHICEPTALAADEAPARRLFETFFKHRIRQQVLRVAKTGGAATNPEQHAKGASEWLHPLEEPFSSARDGAHAGVPQTSARPDLC